MRQKKTSRLLIFGVLSTFVLSWFAIASPQQAKADPFTCEVGFYQMIAGQLTVLDPSDGTYGNIGAPGPNLTNALGYNIEDDYIYAIRNDAGFQGHLVRIHDDGSIDNLGLPAGLPVDSYVAGDFDDAGNLYIREFNNSNEIWVVDVSSNTASVLNLSANLFVSELVFINGYLYGLGGTGFRQIDVNTGTIVTSTVTGLPGDIVLNAAFGAGWATIDDQLFLSRNSTGVIYRIDDYTTPNPVATPVLQGTIPTNNDGASCPNATSPIQELTAVDDSNTVPNSGPLVVSAANGVLQNDMGDTITVTGYTQPTNGSVVINPDGSYTYTPDTGFSGVDTFTYTITDTFGMTTSATVTITVSATNTTSSDTLAETGQQYHTLLMLAVLLGLPLTALVYRSLRSDSYRL